MEKLLFLNYTKLRIYQMGTWFCSPRNVIKTVEVYNEYNCSFFYRIMADKVTDKLLCANSNNFNGIIRNKPRGLRIIYKNRTP